MNSTPDITRPPMRELTPLEARVLGVLVEKQHTVPDTYPLSLNSLTSGCNQKTARSPVMNVSDDDVLSALDGLKRLSLVNEASSSRVPRFEHNMGRVLGIPAQAVALLSTLLLRGAQTAAELRMNSSRLHAFADNSSVEAFLDELATREPARVIKLRRMPGERESRWMHLLCGEVDQEAFAAPATSGALSGDDGTRNEFDLLKVQHKALAEEMKRLRAQIRLMATELGIDIDKAGDGGADADRGDAEGGADPQA